MTRPASTRAATLSGSEEENMPEFTITFHVTSGFTYEQRMNAESLQDAHDYVDKMLESKQINMNEHGDRGGDRSVILRTANIAAIEIEPAAARTLDNAF
jgi:hypothetical protein